MAASKRRALARKITRKQALSYDRVTPNRRGVTSLSEINGRGAYKRRYNATRALLNKKKGKKKARSKKKTSLYEAQLKKGRSPAQARATLRMLRAKKQKSRKRAPAKSRRTAPSRRQSAPQRSKAAFIRSQRKKGRSPAQAAASWQLLCDRVPAVTRSCVAGRARPNRRRAATTTRRRVRSIPNYSPKASALWAKRSELRTAQSRPKARGTSPNPRRSSRSVLSFEEWKSMKQNKRRASKKKKKSSKRRRRARGFAAMSKSKRCALARKGGRKTAAKRRKSRPCDPASKRARRKKKVSGRRKSARKAAPTRRKKKSGKRRRRLSMTKSAVAARRRRRQLRAGGSPAAPPQAYARGYSKIDWAKKNRSMTPNRRRRRRKARRNNATRAMTRYVPPSIRRSSGTYTIRKNRRHKKSYRKNVPGAQFKSELMTAMKYGGIVTAGFIVHRVATNLFDKHILSKVEQLNTGEAANYRKVIAAGIIAAIGIPVTVRALPKHAGVAAAGMAASFIYGLVMLALQKAEQPELLEAVAAYPDAPGYAQYSGYGGYGSYYEYSPHQVYNGQSGYGHSGYGEYYEYGDPQVEQAAAGYGYGMGAEGPPLMQAAAGLQQMYANPPLGEYYAYGAEAIGEYEAVAGGGMGEVTDEGIYPNLHNAEQALNVAEAAAGVGGFGAEGPMLTQAAAGYGDLPLQQTVEPMIRSLDIPDEPGGSRAGILAGGDGIFG